MFKFLKRFLFGDTPEPTNNRNAFRQNQVIRPPKPPTNLTGNDLPVREAEKPKPTPLNEIKTAAPKKPRQYKKKNKAGQLYKLHSKRIRREGRKSYKMYFFVRNSVETRAHAEYEMPRGYTVVESSNGQLKAKRVGPKVSRKRRG